MFEIGKLTRIPLGMQGENNSRSIQVDMKAWLDDWPGATINLLVRRPGEDGFYPANTVINDGVLTWVPTRADVLIAGEGEAQFILTDADDVELRSRVVKTVINESLSGTQGEAPDPETGWVAEVLDAATRAEEAAKRAENAGGGGAGATGADGGFYTPTAEQTDASTLRVSFAASKENMPAIAAVDITLPKGEKGDKGDNGKTPVKGEDYFTEADKEEFLSSVDAVRYSAQTLTNEQKAMVRRNIGVVGTVVPQDYGAKGDGSTDDTTAFQNALANNRIVYVPGGSYKLSAELILGNNCQIELAQDAVLYFTQTTGNCISLKMCSWIKGNHATVSVPYAFTGNVINIDTGYTDDLYDTPPFKHWDPVWKPGRYITDLNIIKPNTYNLCYSDNGECSGTAIYICTDGNDKSTFLWGVDLSGLRIAGAFTYGVYGITENVNGDSGWNHDMKLGGLISGCETGVMLTRVHKVYLSTLIQPQKSRTEVAYAKNGIYLVNCRFMNLINARTFDWNSNFTLWAEGNENQHIALIGDCSGLVLEDWNYYAFTGGYDIRSLIYTDTPSNYERMTILQEPITRWFKPRDGKPYFNDGDFEKRLLLEEEYNSTFQVESVPDFTNVLPTAINKDGTIFNGTGYAKYGVRWDLASGNSVSNAEYYGCTGLIRVKAGDTLYVQAMDINESDNTTGVVSFDSSFNRLNHGSAGHLVGNNASYYFEYTNTDYGFTLTVKNPSDVAYVAFTFPRAGIGENPAISINEPLTYSQRGFLSDGIYIKDDNLIGDSLERANRKVAVISSESTDAQYPSAKAVYDALQGALGAYVDDIASLIGGDA